uniref:Uncharacterized protein n=1 Tax=viral metagenome TaxID=1070528 RepID=A0A6C0KY49_9ZZZZ|tara:strand:- start:10179 stop:10679 length:501 start_codon:yes stop_codon:yes gene_type:complete
MLNESDLEELIFIKKINELKNIDNTTISNDYLSWISFSESSTDDEDSSDSHYFDKKVLTKNTRVYVALTLIDKDDYLIEEDIVTFCNNNYVYSTNKMTNIIKKIDTGNPLQILFSIFLQKGLKVLHDGNTIILPHTSNFVIKEARLLGYEGTSIMSYNVNLRSFCL